jgi:hypothetical protein
MKKGTVRIVHVTGAQSMGVVLKDVCVRHDWYRFQE